jgi:hypothetical protein
MQRPRPRHQRRASLVLSAFTGKMLTPTLIVTATDLASNVTSAAAVIDQFQLQ